MLELFRQSLISQYSAALGMLDRAIEQCDEQNWLKPVGRFPFWHVVYHTLFYTDLYLSRGEKDFAPRPFGREDYQVFGSQSRPPFKKIVADQPYDKPTLREYQHLCLEKSAESVGRETADSLAGPSGFGWLPFPRAQLHLYNLRHIQHHTGQLSAFLAREQGKSVGWIRSGSDQK